MSRLSSLMRSKKLLPAHFRPPPGVAVGRHTYGLSKEKVFMPSPQASLRMGSFCSVAHGVMIMCDGGHSTDCATSYPINRILLKRSEPVPNGGRRRGVTIGNDVWLCHGAVILSGVTIGHGAVIGANAVVTKDVPPYAIAGGAPANVIRYRFPEEIVSKLLAIRWWDWEDDKIKREAADLTGRIEVFISRHFKTS